MENHAVGTKGDNARDGRKEEFKIEREVRYIIGVSLLKRGKPQQAMETFSRLRWYFLWFMVQVRANAIALLKTRPMLLAL